MDKVVFLLLPVIARILGEIFRRCAHECDKLIHLFVAIAPILELIDRMVIGTQRDDRPHLLHLFTRMDDCVFKRDTTVTIRRIARARLVVRIEENLAEQLFWDLAHTCLL